MTLGARLQRLKPWSVRAAVCLGALLLCAIVWFMLCTGPRDLKQYPPAASSSYRLPWTAGITRYCIQGNRAVVSHRDEDEYAYDFAMPVGSHVCAARAGIVVEVIDSHDGNGLDAPNNLISIRHEDGTFGEYLHIRRNGSYVRVGEQVAQGQRIAASGNVGRSMLPHVHFEVRDSRRRVIPVTFEDIKEDRGIPRMFKWYTSGNVPGYGP